MKVFVFGNIASGKSTLVKRLTKHTGFVSVRIDMFRKKYGDGSREGEWKARDEFLAAIDTGDSNQVIEAMGLGMLGFLIKERIKEIRDKIIVIIVNADPEICIKRYYNRKAGRERQGIEQTPIPQHWKGEIADLIRNNGRPNEYEIWDENRQVETPDYTVCRYYTIYQFKNNTEDQLEENCIRMFELIDDLMTYINA